MTHNKEIEDQQEEILDLKVKDSSLTNEMETLRRHASSMSLDLKVLENKFEGVSEREAENVQLKYLVKAQESKLKSVSVNIENIRIRAVVERKSINLKICSLTTELFEANKNMERLKRELGVKMTNCENYKSLLTSLSLEKMKSGKLVADLNKETMKLKMALKKKDFNVNHPNQIKWEGLVKEKTKEIKDMKKVYDEEKRCLEGTLEKKENTIGKLRKEFRHALDQANLLQKHQHNLVEHFKTILKAKQSFRKMGEDDGTVMRIYEEALVTVVKSLVSNGEDYVGQEDCPALENEDNNNVV